MPDTPSIKSVELEDQYYHVRFNDPDQYDTIRTPDWADKASDSVSQGSEVRMGKMKDSDDWEVQSVLIKKEAGEDTAREKAKQIVDKINS